MCTWYPTDSQRNWWELVGRSPVGEGCAVSQVSFSVPIPGASIIAGKGGSCGIEGFQLSPGWNRRTLSFSLCQLSPIESEACFEKSLCCSQHFPDTPGCCKISTGASSCFLGHKNIVWGLFLICLATAAKWKAWVWP